MKQKVTIKFNFQRRFVASDADGEAMHFVPESVDTEYEVYIAPEGDHHIRITLQDGLTLLFLPPGVSDNYTIIWDGWIGDGAQSRQVVTVKLPTNPILESTLILDVVPVERQSVSPYLVFRLPRVFNGIIVERGYCDAETTLVLDGTNPDYEGELKGKVSLMLLSRGSSLRYFCTSFCIDNETQNKNLTTQYGRATVLSSAN